MILINEWNIMRPNGNHNKGIETDRTKLINFKFTCQQNGKRKKIIVYYSNCLNQIFKSDFQVLSFSFH